MSTSSTSTGDSSVQHITSKDQFEYLLKYDRVIVDYSAKWCGPCKAIAPTLERMAKENPFIIFIHLDIDQAEEMDIDVAAITSVPTFALWCKGEQTDKFSGANEARLRQWIGQMNETIPK